MRFTFVVTLFLISSVCGSLGAQRVVLLSEDFQDTRALDKWQVSGSGRVRITEDPRESTNHGLLLDDPIDDASFSSNRVARRFSVVGYSDLTVSLDAYSFDDEVHDGAQMDGLVLRAGDTAVAYRTSWSKEQHFDIRAPSSLLAAANKADGFLTLELHQYDNFSAPQDGLFFDNILVTAVHAFNIFAEAPLHARESEPYKLVALISPPPSAPVELQLMQGSQVHGRATYPAHAASAELTFPSFQNDQLDGPRWVTLMLAEGEVRSSPFLTLIEEDQPAGLSISAPTEIIEGSTANAQVNLSTPHASPVTVTLKSSDPSILAVPAGTILLGGVNGAIIPLRPLADARVLANRSVTITATFGSEKVERSIRILEANSHTPVLTGETNLVEGSTNVFRVSVNAIYDEAITILLTARPASEIIAPASALLPAGHSNVSFAVQIRGDVSSAPSRNFTLQAANGEAISGLFSGLIVDDDVNGFSFSLPQRIEAGQEHALTIRAVNADGTLVRAFSGLVQLLLKDPSNGSEVLLRPELTFNSGMAETTVQIPYAARGHRLLVRSSSGVESVSAPLIPFLKLQFGANDLVYDEKRELIYAISGAMALPGHLHAVTPIVPVTAEIKAPLFLGNEPVNAVITDDERFLYVGVEGLYGVKRVDLDTLTDVATITLEADDMWKGHPFRPYALLAVPGRPFDFIASQADASSPHYTTRRYINGVMQPSSAWNVKELVPGASPNEFYGYDSVNAYYGLMRLELTDDGYKLATPKMDGLISGYVRIAGENGLIFTSTGQVVDGRNMEALAQLKFPEGVGSEQPWDVRKIRMASDLERSRIYYAFGNRIAVYDGTIFRSLGTVELLGIGNITKIIRWGAIGLALLTDKSELILFEDDQLVPNSVPADLQVTLSAGPQPAFLETELTYAARLTNAGPGIAREVRLVLGVSEGQTLQSIDARGRPYSSEPGSLVVEVGDLAPSGTAEVTLKTLPTLLSPLACSAGVVTSSLDSNYANNKDLARVHVGFKSAPATVNIMKTAVNDLLVDPVTGQIIVSVAATAPRHLVNRILRINPSNGLITASVLLAGEPKRLAISDDGSTVYAVGPAGRIIYRADLSTQTAGQSFTLGPDGFGIAASDLEVLPGSRDAVIVGGWEGARIFVDGVAQPQGSGNHRGSMLVLMPSPNDLFGLNSDGSYEAFKYEAHLGGIFVKTERTGLFTGYAGQPEGDGYYIYDGSGRAVRADLMTIDGTFPVASSLPDQFGYAAVEPDRAHRRVYFARGKSIASFDSESYLHVRTVTLPLPSNITLLERWGIDGFAAKLENGEVAIIRNDIVSTSAGAIDLLTTLPELTHTTNSTITIGGHAFSGQGISNVMVGATTATSVDGFAHWTATIQELRPGTNLVEITATSRNANPETRAILRQIVYTPSDSAQNLFPAEWLARYFPGSESAMASGSLDTDNDGQSNLAEYIFGTNPRQPDKPVIRINRVTDAEMRIELIRPNSTTHEFILYSSRDLKTWSEVPARAQQEALSGDTEGLSRMTFHFTPNAQSSTTFYKLAGVTR